MKSHWLGSLLLWFAVSAHAGVIRGLDFPDEISGFKRDSVSIAPAKERSFEETRIVYRNGRDTCIVAVYSRDEEWHVDGVSLDELKDEVYRYSDRFREAHRDSQAIFEAYPHALGAEHVRAYHSVMQMDSGSLQDDTALRGMYMTAKGPLFVRAEFNYRVEQKDLRDTYEKFVETLFAEVLKTAQ